eukprot:TRINITY_DN40647_c1_g1_i1.p2 TRINITY_DN40647_c1_g1~~TRINITY_DN40647_c1_g1_i1.p2  ORF type:complete len:63 (-),score=14.74 TRINITY_DN40647_c1_g1_i1:55-243(-)
MTPQLWHKIMVGIFYGLVHLNKQGIYHRVIKPANILVHDGQPKLADFGVSSHKEDYLAKVEI